MAVLRCSSVSDGASSISREIRNSVVLQVLGVGGGLHRRCGVCGRAGDLHLPVPGGKAGLEFLDEGGPLVGQQLGQGVLHFVGEVVFAHLRRLVGEIDLNQPQAIDGGGDEPRDIRGLVRHGAFPFLRAVKRRNSSGA